MIYDIIEAVKDGKALFEWEEVTTSIEEKKLHISIMRDAIRFNNIPALRYDRKGLPTNETFNGVRLPATAIEMQSIADMLFCMMPTPKILDTIWLQATTKFDPVVNLGPGKIVATQNITSVHTAIEKKIKDEGGYPSRGIIDSVGKYWVITNKLKNSKNLKYGVKTSCNYGWHNSTKEGSRAVTPGLYVYQGQGTMHNDIHIDPSQVVRLMYRIARLEHEDGKCEKVDLHNIASDEKLSYLLNHDGVLHVLRQPSVPETPPVKSGNTWVLPEITIYSNVPPSEMNDDELKAFKAGFPKA